MFIRRIYSCISFVTILLLILISASCTREAVDPNRNTNNIEGTGNIVTEVRDIGIIDSVKLTTVGTLYIEQSDDFSLELEAEDNILPLIISDIQNGELTISKKKGFNLTNIKGINYYLTVKDLYLISLTSSGNVECDRLETEELKLDLSSSGSIEIVVNVENLEADISSAGDVIISGETKKQNIDLSSSGNYEAKNLKSTECDIDISSSGSATVYVSKYLDANLSSSGNLYYIGDPETDITTSSSGKVESID